MNNKTKINDLIYSGSHSDFMDCFRYAEGQRYRMFEFGNKVYSTECFKLFLNIHDGNLGKEIEDVKNRSLLFLKTTSR